MQDREIKHYFRNEHNMLNKGHMEREQSGTKSSPKHNLRIDKVLPPIEVISEYEALYPGTLEHALSIAQKEQDYRHKTTHTILRINFIARVLGQMFGACSTIFVFLVVLKFAKMGFSYKALSLGGMYTASLTLVSIFGIYWDKVLKTKGLRNNNNNKNKNKLDRYKR